jgi:hypothetical protein
MRGSPAVSAESRLVSGMASIMGAFYPLVQLVDNATTKMPGAWPSPAEPARYDLREAALTYLG